ncbi:hypothetical protein GQ53DRAFT_869901 [Thozetella sp. PMI_491]|nr:hypothetical protein GQ53DRAFT_869901 [Thozetella sp. PMI_491]
MSHRPAASEPFAIVGVSLKLPQEAVDEASLWRVLEDGKNLMTEWPKSRISLGSFAAGGEPGNPNTIKGPGAHFINQDPAVFDAPFFAITTKEAVGMSPLQRWTLEAAYHAFENAGIPAESLRGSRTGVFAAYMNDDFMAISTRDPDQLPRQAATGLAPMMIPNRISWYFGMQGPSVLVETGCSGAMVAIDMACNAMRCSDADMALVVGSTMLLGPDSTIMLSSMGFLSPDSRSYSFDARANGYARGEGVVALVLKPLHRALKDGDVVRAVVRATGQNQDGRTPILTQPSADAQEALIRHVYGKAGLGFEETRYFEAHGTGTPTGDVVEMTGIGKVFRNHRSPEQPLYVGSIKTNIGHIESASACASIVKAIMILEKGVIPPNALFESMNPGIDADYYHVPTKSIPWPTPGLRRISVNSFGVGGANAHAILDDAYHYLQTHGLVGFHHCTTPEPEPSLRDASSSSSRSSFSSPSSSSSLNTSCEPDHLAPRLLVWSAADAGAIRRMLASYQVYFETHTAGDARKLEQLAYTLATRRSLMAWRSFAVVDAKTRELTATTAVRVSSGGGIAFVFTGQGAQYAGMGLELLRYPIFEESLKRSNEVLASLGCEWSIFDELHNVERIHRPESSQPLCTALQIALVELLQSFGVLPAVVLGHSSGEIAAAYAVGALTHDSACRVAYWRGQLAGKLRGTGAYNGAMISVNLSQSQVPAYLDKVGLGGLHQKTIHTACINSPTNVTLSGPSDILDVLKARLDQENIFAHKINTGVAYHSPAMRTIAAEYMERLGSLQAVEQQRLHISMVSSVSAQVVAPELLSTPQYWVDNLVSPVRFSEAVQSLIDVRHALSSLPPGVDAITDVIEIGPHSALRRIIKDNVLATSSSSPESKTTIRYHASLERSKSALHTMAYLVGSLFSHGHPVSVSTANRIAKGSLPALVDCPRYPFDHGRRYWNESRLSRDFRLRAHSDGYLLGRRTNDWNALRPRWRNWLCISGSVVCPGTGMVVMALEAAKQLLTTDSRPISSFVMKQGQFLAPITVGETLEDATETELHLRPITSAHEKEITWFEVSIFSYREGRWTENFQAQIHAQFEDDDSSREVDGGKETRLDRQRIRKHVEQAFTQCVNEVNVDAFYSFVSKSGSNYGPSFRQLAEIRWDGHATTVARVNMASMKKHSQHLTESPVHPAIMDAAVHLINSSISRGLTEQIPTLVPRRFASLWISAKIWDQETTSLRLVSELRSTTSSSVNGVEKDLYALADDGTPLAVLDHLAYMNVSGVQRSHESDDLDADCPLLYGIAWKPQLSVLEGPELQKLCDATASSMRLIDEEVASAHFIDKLERAMGIAARKALRSVTQEHLDRGPVFIRKYAASLQRQFGSHESSSSCTDNEEVAFSDSALEILLHECETERPAWRLLTTISRALGSILRAETNPMELLFSADTAASDYYSDLGYQFMQDGRFAYFLDLASHETPDLRVLEVGAGTGGTTCHMLAALQAFETATGQTRFAEYTFTDISSGFFNAARKQFSAWEDRMSFKALDIEHDPASQGYEAGSYDMVVAASVVHATSDLIKTLRHLRSLLRPRGHLVLIEPISSQSAHINVAFGCFEGWWAASEPWRQDSPVVSERRWDELMREAGFSGTVLTIRDHESEACHFSSIMVATAIETTLDDNSNIAKETTIACHDQNEVVILFDPLTAAQASLAADIAKYSPNSTRTAMLDAAHFGQGESLPSIPKNGVVISLLEVGQPRLASLSEADFSLLKNLIQIAPQILWVLSPPSSPEGDLSANTNPHYSVATGLLRVIRCEDPNKHLVTVLLEQDSLSSLASRANFVTKVLQSCFLDQPTSKEAEFVVQDGHLAIGRTLREIRLDEERVSRIRPRLRPERWQSGPAVALEVGTPGLLDTLQFKEDPVGETQLGADEVEIKAEFWPLSFRDLFIALGRLGQQEKMGFECAGTVTRVGLACLSSVRPGDRVIMGVFGSMCSHPRAEVEAVLRVPDCLSLKEAVASIGPGMTAYHALVNAARLQRGEKILIHSAAGATGQFAVGVAKMIGAEVFATVGHNDKKQLLMDRFDIPEDHIFYSRNTSFAQGVKRVTCGYGVDVVLNSLSGDSLRASWECIAAYGRFIEIGKVDIGANSLLPMGQFAKNASFTAVDMVHIQMTNKQLARQLMEKALHLAARADLVVRPSPLHLYPVSEVEKAFRYMQSGKHSGRILVSIEDGDMVSKSMTYRSTWRFSENASYIIAGGLGGLGRPIIRWMADRGAKYLIILSRSGATSEAAIELVSELRAKNVHVLAPQCDVSSATEVSAALSSALTSTTPGFPPIKGCVNATMVLQDSIFENMTHAQWSRTIRSKVNTSWNLHQILPQNLDFFILLSSIVGVYGSPGQGNYAAGCTFQDALARHRTATGHRASVSLDLGWMRDDGVVHESADYQRRLANIASFKPVATADLLALLDYYCDPALPPLTLDQSQVLVGVSTPTEARARGGETYWSSCTRLFAGFDVAQSAHIPGTNPTSTTRHNRGEDNAAQLFSQAEDPVERTKIVVAALRAKLARALGVEIDEIDSGKGLADYGVDSLMAVELRNWIQKDFGVGLAVFEIMQGGKTIRDAGALVEAKKGDNS